MSSGGHDGDVTVDPIAVETAALDGDDIVVERDLERPVRTRGTTRRRGIASAIAAAALALGAVGVGIMVTRDGDDVAARAAQTPNTAATTVGPTAVPTTPPTTPPTAGSADVVPLVPAPVLPAPTAPVGIAPTTEPPVGLGAPAFEVTIDPASSAVAAGTPVTVTLRVRNDGGETLHYAYDNDGCDPTLVVSGDIVCSQAIRTLDVAPGTEASQAITIGTDGAQPNDYTVAIGDRTVLITIL